MINLTRANGYGSLAHEWGHFMDNILSTKGGNSEISNSGSYETKQVNNISEIPHGAIYTIQRKKKNIRFFFDKNAKNPMYPFARLESGQTEPDEKSSYVKFWDYKITVDIPKNIKHEVIAKNIADLSNKSLRDQTKKVMVGMEPGSFEYEFIKDLILDDPYLNQKDECFARAFESYVADKIEDAGRKNTYLSSKQKTVGKDGNIIYPQKEYRNQINKMFDEFFDEIRIRDELKKAIDKNFNEVISK
jgi:hypothetical protein